MGGIEAVLERLVADPAFRVALARDPEAALLPYDLTADDVALLASRLDDGDDTQRAVEQRTSKSAMLAAVDMLDGGHGIPGGEQDEALASPGDRTDGVAEEYTKVPAPPAPFTPTPLPNTAEAEVTMESLELSAEGVELEDDGHELTHVQQQADDAAAPLTRRRSFGDITLKRGVTDEPSTGPDDVLEIDDA